MAEIKHGQNKLYIGESEDMPEAEITFQKIQIRI